MVTTNLAEFSHILKPGMRLLGLDLGTKTIGLAAGSLSIGVATPLFTIRRTQFQKDARELLALAAKEGIGAFVLGMPFNMDGSEGPRAQSTRAFARNLQPLSCPPILLWDERLSSSAAEDGLIHAGVSHRKRAKIIDSAAAAVILQDVFHQLASMTE